MKTQQSGKTFKTVRPKTAERMYEFANSEALTQCIIMLYRKKSLRNLESSLYKMPDCYRLIIKSAKTCESFLYAKEFCQRYSNSSIQIGSTTEYGKLLIEKQAIKIYGNAFNRGT